MHLEMDLLILIYSICRLIKYLNLKISEEMVSQSMNMLMELITIQLPKKFLQAMQ